MTDGIFGNRFLGRQPAWHHLGTVIDPTAPLAPLEALAVAGADYEVRTTKLVTEAFGTRIDTGRVAIVRQPLPDDEGPRVLGIATKSYKPIQNRELMAAIAPISDEYGWPVETVGALGHGERVFMTLKAGEIEVPGDTSPVTMFFLITGGHDGGTAVKIATTPVRVVCQNTLIMGLAAANITSAVNHAHDALGEVKFAVDITARMQAASESVASAMRLLAAKPVEAGRLDAILDAAYPTPAESPAVARARAFLDSTVTLTPERQALLQGKIKKSDAWVETIKVRRAAAADRLEIFNDEFPQVANTCWAAYNAVAETEAYRRGANDTTIARDLMFGGGRGQSVTAAWDTAYAIATGS